MYVYLEDYNTYWITYLESNIHSHCLIDGLRSRTSGNNEDVSKNFDCHLGGYPLSYITNKYIVI